MADTLTDIVSRGDKMTEALAEKRIRKEGNKFILFSKDGKKRLGSFSSHEAAVKRERQIQALKSQASVELTIVRASIGKDGVPRWLAAASHTSPDKAGDRTSKALFLDWIERVEKAAITDWLPAAPRVPFLGLSHYPALDGYGEAGPTEKMFVDGDYFKAGGPFIIDDESPLGKALFDAIKTEREVIQRGEGPDEPIRISAAWWDLQHSHGDFIFTRKSLDDRCPMCKNGMGNRMFLKGQLDHFAATRSPMQPRTSLELESKMAEKTRKDDAESIVGKDLAKVIDQKTAAVVGKSEAEDTPAMVVKDEAAEATPPPAPDAEKAHGEAMGDEFGFQPLGGATTIADAEDFIQAEQMQDRLWDNFSLFRIVSDNILSGPDVEDRQGALSNAIKEFGARVDTAKSAAADAFLTQSVTRSNIMTEQAQQPETPNDPILQIKTAIDAAVADPTLNRDAKLAAVQPLLDNIAGVVQGQIDAVAPAPPGAEFAATLKAEIAAGIAEGNAGLIEQVAQLSAQIGQQRPVQPIQRSYVPGTQPHPQATVAAPEPKSAITEMVRKSVGLTS